MTVAAQPEAALPTPIDGARNLVLVASGKGGVGKSTIAVNLALALAAQGVRTGLTDLDVSGPSLSRLTGGGEAPELNADGLAIPREAHGVHVISAADVIPPEQAIAWKGPMIAQAVEQLVREVAWPCLEVLVADLPPGTGDVQLTALETLPVTGAVVVTTPERMATLDAERAVSLFHDHDVPVFGVVRNMATFVCPCCGEEQPLYAPDETVDVAKRMHIADLGAVPAVPEAAALAARGVPIMAAEPDGPAATAFMALAERLHAALTREAAAAARRERDAGEPSIWELLNDDDPS